MHLHGFSNRLSDRLINRPSLIKFALLGRLSRSLDQILERRLKKPNGSVWLSFLSKLTTSLYNMIWSSIEVSMSFSMSLWICGGGLMWGTLKIWLVRRDSSITLQEVWSQKNTWSFGQVLPMLLLILPLLAFFEGYYGTFTLS